MVTPMKPPNPIFMNGVPELLVLRLLARRAMYGYEIVKEIHLQTQQALSFGEGCIYPCLHALEGEGLVRSRREKVEGRSRHYYQLTPAGKKRLATMAAEWERTTTAIAAVMGGQHV
jgi:PadR family transcriptional regulator, regulatory protein PadR